MKQKLPALLLEISCIFVAVTMSFYLDELRESRHEKEQIREIVRSLIIDIESANKILKTGMKYTSEAVHVIDRCLKMAKAGEKVDGDLLRAFHYIINDDHSFVVSSSSAYTGLLSSNVWQQFPDSVRRSVFDLYELKYKFNQLVIAQNSANNAHFKQHYLPKLDYSFYNPKLGDPQSISADDYLVAQKAVQESLTDREYRSVLIIIRNQYNKAAWFQRDAESSGEATISVLKQYLTEL